MGQQKRGKRIRDKGKEAKGIGEGSIQEKGAKEKWNGAWEKGCNKRKMDTRVG